MEIPPFKLNGCINEPSEPYPFLDQAHGVLCCLEAALRDGIDGEDGPLNFEILTATANAARSLVHLAALGLDTMDRKQRGR